MTHYHSLNRKGFLRVLKKLNLNVTVGTLRKSILNCFTRYKQSRT